MQRRLFKPGSPQYRKAEHGAGQHDVTEFARLDQRPQELRMAWEGKGIADVQIHLLALGEIDELSRFDRIEHHRFLDHNIGTCQQRVFHQAIVGMVRRDDDNGVRLHRQ